MKLSESFEGKVLKDRFSLDEASHITRVSEDVILELVGTSRILKPYGAFDMLDLLTIYLANCLGDCPDDLLMTLRPQLDECELCQNAILITFSDGRYELHFGDVIEVCSRIENDVKTLRNHGLDIEFKVNSLFFPIFVDNLIFRVNSFVEAPPDYYSVVANMGALSVIDDLFEEI